MKETDKYKNLKKIMMCMVLLGIGLLLFDWIIYQGRPLKELEKSEPGQGSYTEELEVSTTYYKGVYEVEVPEKAFSKKEAEALLEKAKKEIDDTFLGNNSSLEQITEKVILKKKYQKGLVKAQWGFDDYNFVTSEGEIRLEQVKEPVYVQAQVELCCGEYESMYLFPFCVVPPKPNSKQGILQSIQKSLEENSKEESFVLPEQLQGEKVTWRRKMTYRGLGVGLLGFMGWLLVPFCVRWEKKQKKEKEKQMLLRDYPGIVSQLSLLLQVGLSLSEAVERISLRYERKKKMQGDIGLGYEMIGKLHREIADGTGELMALEHFAKRTEQKEYRKLVLLLQQNIKKGNEAIVEALEKEHVEAFELRKMTGRRKGEEASTKLLFPMIGMLGIVLCIIIAPAWMALGKT